MTNITLKDINIFRNKVIGKRCGKDDGMADEVIIDYYLVCTAAIDIASLRADVGFSKFCAGLIARTASAGVNCACHG